MTVSESAVGAAYGSLAGEYAERFGDVRTAHPMDRAMFAAFTELVQQDGGRRVADLGCGPGHWTAHLHAQGLDACGVDLSPAFVELAMRRHPGLRFDVSSMTALDLDDASFDGVVAWYSIIHTAPAVVPSIFAEIARVLVPGGRLLLACHTTDRAGGEPLPYDHKVAPAYRWSIQALAELLSHAGIEVTARSHRQPEGSERVPQAYLLARKAAAGKLSSDSGPFHATPARPDRAAPATEPTPRIGQEHQHDHRDSGQRPHQR